MKRLRSCVAILTLALTADAQSPCPNADLSDHPGAWKARTGYMGASQFSAPRGSYDRAAADATLTRLLTLLQSAYPDPKGGMAYFTKYLTFSTPYRQMSFGYSLYVGHTGFYCTSANRVVESGESGVFINVDVNSFSTSSLISAVTAPTISTSGGPLTPNADENGDYRIGGQPVYQIPSVSRPYKGADHFAKASMTRSGQPPAEQYFVFRKRDMPLFSYVTRRDYLKQFRGELEAYKSRELEAGRANAGRPGASTSEWLAKFSRGMDAYIKSVDAYLTNQPEAELSRPVSELLPHFPIDLENPELKLRDGDRHLIYLNQAYLDKKQPYHIPQFIVIRLSIREMANSPAWEKRFQSQVSGQLDFAAISALLGKP